MTRRITSEGLYPPHPPEPAALILAIVKQAMRDIVNKPRKGSGEGEDRAWRADALAWFRSDDTGRNSYLWCCAALDWLPGPLREQVEAYVTERDPERKRALARRMKCLQRQVG